MERLPGQQIGPVGIPFDSSRVDEDGTTHYYLKRAGNRAEGPAQWTDEHDCNPLCGCHLASKCTGCNTCTWCEGCYCNGD